MTSYLNAMRNYFNFKGRASRSEFWLFLLFVVILSIITLILDEVSGFADEGAMVFTGLLSLIHLIPSISVSVRRLHDINKTGWWLLIGLTGIGQIILIVFYCLESTAGQNRYGPDPRHNGSTMGHSGSYSAYQPAGGTTQHPQPPYAPQAASSGVIEQIEKLTSLRKQGAIDEAEFSRLKTDLLTKGS